MQVPDTGRIGSCQTQQTAGNHEILTPHSLGRLRWSWKSSTTGGLSLEIVSDGDCWEEPSQKVSLCCFSLHLAALVYRTSFYFMTPWVEKFTFVYTIVSTGHDCGNSLNYAAL